MLDTHGLSITYAPTTGPAWRITSIERLSKAEGGNTPAIYVRVWDAAGARASDAAMIRAAVPGQPVRHYQLNKPNSPIERGHGDVPLAKGAVYAISIEDEHGSPSDVVGDLRSDQPLPGEDWGHVTWRLGFTFQDAEGPVVGPPDPPIGEGVDRAALRALVAEGQAWLARVAALAE
jgi:hypothetical protein